MCPVLVPFFKKSILATPHRRKCASVRSNDQTVPTVGGTITLDLGNPLGATATRDYNIDRSHMF
jgi:hypothetical protein